MDQRVKRMLKLIEEEADSFAKKAEMYYQKRPELICHVEEFYRLYRSLAERYDHVVGDLRKNDIPSDLQSQGSIVSDVISSDLPSTCPSPDQRPSRRISAAGGGTDSSSLSDSETESDCSQGVHRRKIIELEIELREAREKLRLQEERNLIKGVKNDNTEAAYSQELRLANEENSRLKIELQKYNSSPIMKTDHIDNLYGSLDGLKSERDRLKSQVISRDDRIDQMEKHNKELEEEIEKQRVLILEGAEEKREAIRQLCFSLEHYRSGYISLLRHKTVAVLASRVC